MMRVFVCAFALSLHAICTQAAEFVATRTLPAGTVVLASDLAPGAGSQGTADRNNLVGLETRRTIYKGGVVSRDDLQSETLVHRNEVVEMIFHRRGLRIRAEGRALGAGAAGQSVRVMNLQSRTSVIATVKAPGIVQVLR